MLDSSSSADFEGANSEQKRIKLEEQLGQTQGKVGVVYGGAFCFYVRPCDPTSLDMWPASLASLCSVCLFAAGKYTRPSQHPSIQSCACQGCT